jgi:hypothetical protein
MLLADSDTLTNCSATTCSERSEWRQLNKKQYTCPNKFNTSHYDECVGHIQCLPCQTSWSRFPVRPQSLPANFGIVPKLKPRWLLSAFLTIHYQHLQNLNDSTVSRNNVELLTHLFSIWVQQTGIMANSELGTAPMKTTPFLKHKHLATSRFVKHWLQQQLP